MEGFPAAVRAHPAKVTAVMTVAAYALVIGTFLDLIPIYPTIDLQLSTLLSHAIAGVNALTVITLSVGWLAIRRGQIRRHRAAMIAAIGLILIFLVLYLTRVGGGGTKHFVGPELVTLAYLLMLGIHIVLSVIAVPLVLYAFLLGVSRSPSALRGTRHATVGRIAAGSWLVSLLLGLVTYLMLEHLYGWEYVTALFPVVV